jgi:hypothetical protein
VRPELLDIPGGQLKIVLATQIQDCFQPHIAIQVAVQINQW